MCVGSRFTSEKEEKDRNIFVTCFLTILFAILLLYSAAKIVVHVLK